MTAGLLLYVALVIALAAGAGWALLLRATVFGAAAALALLAACEAKVPTGPEIDAMDAASAERATTQAQLFASVRADSVMFYVDGKRVDAATAYALTPTRIATVGIDETNAPARKVIYINTRRQPADAPAGSGMKLRTPDSGQQLGARAVRPLILIDGVKATDAQLTALDRDRIATINVYKGPTALTMSSDPAAKNGIIEVTTKK